MTCTNINCGGGRRMPLSFWWVPALAGSRLRVVSPTRPPPCMLHARSSSSTRVPVCDELCLSSRLLLLCPVLSCSAKCLRNRHGEDCAAAEASDAWWCPCCRGSCGAGCVGCCNCGLCRKKVGGRR